MEKRADKYLARQDAFLIRAVARVWKARERGKLLERVREMRLVKNSMTVWKNCLRERKHLQGEHYLAIKLFQRSTTSSQIMLLHSPCDPIHMVSLQLCELGMRSIQFTKIVARLLSNATLLVCSMMRYSNGASS